MGGGGGHLFPSPVTAHPLALDCDKRFHRASPLLLPQRPSRMKIGLSAARPRQADIAQAAKAGKSLQGSPPPQHRGLEPLPELIG